MNFLTVQQAFIDYIRDPALPLPPGTDKRRMQIYRELFFNNIKGFISSGFPVLCSLYEEDDWNALVQDFFMHHECQTPIFIEIAQEFLLFLQHEYQPNKHDAPFMLELAHYEWLELLVATVPAQPIQHPFSSSELENTTLCLNVAAQVAQYHFDVQHISPSYRPLNPGTQPQFFCIYRDAQDEVCFLQLNPLTAQVLAYIGQSNGVTFREVGQWLKQTFNQMDGDMLVNGSRQMLIEMSDKNIVLAQRG